MSRSGVEKAAILLLTLGEQDAAQVLKHLGAKDVQRVGSAMAQLSGISREEVVTVLSSFSTELEQQTSVGIDADAARHLRVVDGGAYRGAHAGFFHHQPQRDADRQRHADHEHAIDRQIDAADDHALREAGGRVDVHVIAAPDVERALLEQEGKADREQHLPQRVGFDGDHGNAAQQQIEPGSDDQSGRGEVAPVAENVRVPAADREAH